MLNRQDGLLADIGGRTLLLPIDYTDDDVLVCVTPEETLEFGPSESQLTDLLKELRDRGLCPKGCFNCKYFIRSGMQVESAPTVGYCLEGNTGRHVGLPDITSMERSCDAYAQPDPSDPDQVQRDWQVQIQDLRKE